VAAIVFSNVPPRGRIWPKTREAPRSLVGPRGPRALAGGLNECRERLMPLDKNPIPFEFNEVDKAELRSLLKERFAKALPGLQIAADLFSIMRRRSVSSARSLQETERLEALLGRVENAAASLSPEAIWALQTTIDKRMSIDINAWVTAFDAVSIAVRACRRVRELLTQAQGHRRPSIPSPHFLATSVGSALTHAGVPLSKGRDALFARVLTVVWHAVEPGAAPMDVFPYIKAAADFARLQDPQPRIQRGRPRKRK
jgi:hypothetical protein